MKGWPIECPECGTAVDGALQREIETIGGAKIRIIRGKCPTHYEFEEQTNDLPLLPQKHAD